MSDHEPGHDLKLHRAPEHLMDAVLAEVNSGRPRRVSAVPIAMTLASVLGIGIGWFGHDLATSPTAQYAEAQTEQDVVVRFVLHAPEAQQVHVAGSFNDWQPTAAPLERTSDGTWVVRLSLQRGRYEYMFVVDGETWMPDPTAPLTVPDDFGRSNAILDV